MGRGNKLSNEYLLLSSLLLVGIFFFLLDTVGALSFVRSGISFVMYPVAFQANQTGTAAKRYSEIFVRFDEFQDEYNQLKIDIYEKEVENSFYALLKEENESLKKQIALGSNDQNYILAKALGGSDYSFVRLNKGESDGVAIGDIVVSGNMFVGIVIESDLESCLVRLPNSYNSSLEVIVVRGGVEEARLPDSINFLSKGVVKGSPDGIKVENMSMNADLKDGDIVIVNDSKVGEYLVLGYLVGLSDNAAATSRTGFVSPILDYDKLITVFVNTDF